MKLLVGLGNPGVNYENTRHNVGFLVIDALADEMGIEVTKKHGKSLLGQGHFDNCKVLLLKPQTFMNNSGEAVIEMLNFYKDRIEDLIVIHDDMDLDLGHIRFKAGGGTGGHNGLKSITSMLASNDYDRLRIGIGHPDDRNKVINYVLNNFKAEEKEILSKVIELSKEGLKKWCKHGVRKAMNDHNGQKIILSKENEDK